MTRTFWLGLLSLTLLAGTSFAESKIAVLDVVQVVNASEANKAAGKKMTDKRDAIQVKIDKLKAPLVEKERHLNERRSMMTDEQFIKEQTELRKEVNNFKFEAQEMEAGLQAEVMKHRKEIADAVSEIVAEIAEEKGYEVVLPRNVLLFAGNEVNISAEVLKRLNARLK